MIQGNIDIAELVHRIDQKMNMAPDYDTGWTALAQDTTATLTHSLGGDADKYLVDLMMKDTGATYGVNIFGLGSREITGGTRVGYYYLNLTNSTVQVYREANDPSEQYRLRIWKNQYQ